MELEGWLLAIKVSHTKPLLMLKLQCSHQIAKFLISLDFNITRHALIRASLTFSLKEDLENYIF